MGTEVHLLALGGPKGALDRGIARLHELEARWSRFRPTSDISRLNMSAGTPIVVSSETTAAVMCSIEGWRLTGGRFDPTVGAAIRRCGYDRTFEAVAYDERTMIEPAPAPGCVDITVDHVANLVALPAGVELDLGGIGKGLAADWLVAQLLAEGVASASVNMGGDVRVGGASGVDEDWVIGVEHPGLGEVGRVALSAGAVATTSTRKRRWGSGDKARHHIIDPRTGDSASTHLAGVTVIAGSAALAEVLCKALLLGDPEYRRDVVARFGVTALLVDRCGQLSWLAPDGVRQ